MPVTAQKFTSQSGLLAIRVVPWLTFVIHPAEIRRFLRVLIFKGMSMRKIGISDCTLKKYADDAKIAGLLFREKIIVAECIDTFGADCIEFPAVKNPGEDTIVYKTLAAAVKNCSVAMPVGEDEESVLGAWNCLKEAKDPILQIEVPVSTVGMEYKYHLKEAGMIKKVSALCSCAKKYCDHVELVARDASRTEPDFLVNLAVEAQKAGATRITVCDDAGIFLPAEVNALVSKLRVAVDGELYFEASDELGFGVADSFTALCAGADGVKAAVSGKNCISEVVLANAIEAKGSAFGIETGIITAEADSDVYGLLKKIGKSKPKMNDASGSDDVFFDTDSTIEHISKAAFSLGYELSDEDVGKVADEVQHVCRDKGSIGKKEFEAIIASSAMQVPDTYHIKGFVTQCGDSGGSMSRITLEKGKEILEGVAIGNGPIDSAFNAIEQCIGHHYELDNFEIQAVTEGKEALGSTVVRLIANGKMYSGNGISPDIVSASIRAYVNALNKIAYSMTYEEN